MLKIWFFSLISFSLASFACLFFGVEQDAKSLPLRLQVRGKSKVRSIDYA